MQQFYPMKIVKITRNRWPRVYENDSGASLSRHSSAVKKGRGVAVHPAARLSHCPPFGAINVVKELEEYNPPSESGRNLRCIGARAVDFERRSLTVMEIVPKLNIVMWLACGAARCQ